MAAVSPPVSVARRTFLGTGIGLTGGVLAAGPIASAAATTPPARTLDLSDRRVALTSYVKLRGSLADQTVYQPYEGDIFLVADDQVGIPLCGFRGIQKSRWRRDAQGGFTNQDYDLGFYVDYHSREILKTWDNPLTGRTVDVVHYRGGPSGGHFRVGQQAGDVYGEAAGRWMIAGDQISHTSAHWGERPNPLSPAEWPLASSGKVLRGSMSMTFAGRVSEVANPAIAMAPALQLWTNTTDWMPWMAMGRRPGFNLWRWVGAKGTDPAMIDPELVAAAEMVWPGYVHGDKGWRTPTSGRDDFVRRSRGLPLTD